MKDFRQLKVWENAHQITLNLYKITTGFPKHELFGLTSQIRRCVSSILRTSRRDVEGQGTLSCIASCKSHGSANELEYHLLLAKDLGYIEQASYQSVLDKLLTLKRMLVTLTRKVAAERGTN